MSIRRLTEHFSYPKMKRCLRRTCEKLNKAHEEKIKTKELTTVKKNIFGIRFEQVQKNHSTSLVMVTLQDLLS